MVQTNGANTDDLQVLGSVQDGLVDGGVNAHNQHVIIGNQGGQLLLSGEHLGVHLHILAEFFGNSAVNGIDDQTLHKITPFLIKSVFEPEPRT